MSRADIHQFGWPNSELIMPISRVNRPQSRGWFDYNRNLAIDNDRRQEKENSQEKRGVLTCILVSITT